MFVLGTLWCRINVPPPRLLIFENFSYPPVLIRTPVYKFSPILILATVKFPNTYYRLKVFQLISMCQKYIFVENESISPGFEIDGMKLYPKFT